MELHHTKHHQTYITNLNAALDAQSTAHQTNDVPQLIALQQKIKFNGGGHINHSLFWTNLAPYGSAQTDIARAAPTLKAAIEAQWGSVEQFQAAFTAVLLGLQGSGWGWLVRYPGAQGRLGIVSTKDQDPVTEQVPVLGVDMWEHAYYLQVSSLHSEGLSLLTRGQYTNNKASYANEIWKVINWQTAEERYQQGVVGSSLKL